MAIVCAACRFPGADTPAELWRLARNGRTCFGPPPKGRWPAATAFTGAFLADVQSFDAGRFNVAAADVQAIDPQQRLILTLVDETRSLGPSLDTSEIGVFVGAGHPANVEAVASIVEGPCPKELLSGNLLSLIAARVAYTFDLHGPVATIDSACASSLVALHQACQALRDEECEAAYVGGVHLNLTPLVHRLFEHAGALSPSGRLLPFHEDGDGTLPADGAGVIVVERLSRARRLGHRVWAIVLGSAVNNCGRTMGVMAPKPAPQIAVMRRALARAQVDPGEIRFVEAHATGTRLGDAIERRSLAAVYPHGPRIGAIKGQIGHALTAAGMASLIRAIGELGTGEAGAVSAFGFGGTNAHVVLRGEAAPRPEEPSPPRQSVTPASAPREPAAEDDLAGWVSIVERGPEGEPIFRQAPTGVDPLREGGRYLLTGASGGLGGEVARFLAGDYRARLVLTGRRPADDSMERLVADLKAAGGDAVYVQADLTCQTDIARLLDAAHRHLGEVDGLFHLAGTTGEGAMAIKRDGLLALRPLEARVTVLFSSISAIFTSLTAGLEAYAAANAWLDAHAIGETQAGRRVVSIAWAPWMDVGMAAERAEFYRRRGIEPLAPSLAVRAMRRAIACGAPHVTVHRRDPVDHNPPATALPLDLREEVYALIAEYGDVPADRIRGDAHLMALGIDSLSAVGLVGDLEQRLGLAIPTTFLFEYDTVDALIEGLGRLVPGRPDQAPGVKAPSAHDSLPLLDVQQTFLVQQQYFPDLPNNVFLACTVDTPDGGPLVRERLASGLAAAVTRHPVLRSVVAREGDQWVQRLGPAAPPLVWVDQVDDERVASTIFNLEQGPLMRLVSDGRRVALQAHHLLVDAWSAKLVLEEVFAAYAAADTDEPAPRPAPPCDWWTASALLSQTRSDGARSEFWQQRLDALPPLPLPWDGDPRAVPRGPARVVTLSLPAELSKSLDDLARRESVTLSALVLAGYAQLLFDISGQHDLLVRVALARRDLRLEGIAEIVGSFADSLPIRITLHAGEEPGAFARRVQAELHAVRQHAGGVSSIALAKLGTRVGAGPAGLTPAGFSFVTLDAPATIGNLRFADVVGASASGFTRLGLIGWSFGGRLGFSFNYLDSLFDRSTVAAMAVRIEKIFAAWTTPRVETLRTERRLDGELVRACERFEGRRLMPGLSYAALARGSAALAARLPATRIAVLADPGPVGTLAIVATLRAGGTYVPLDPDWPDARIQQVLEEAKPGCLLTAAESTDRASGLAGALPVMAVDVAACAAAAQPASSIRPAGAPAYIMFTSGSTGRPKGVVVGHAAVLTLLDWAQRMLQPGDEDCFLQSSALTFGASLRQTFVPILTGTRAASLPPHRKRDPALVLEALAEHRVTILNCVPSVWSLLMDAARAQGSTAALAALKWLLIGGEAVPVAYWERWRTLVPSGPRVANLYGGAETIANVTWFEVPPDFGSDEAYLPVGWPRYGMRLSVEESGDLAVSGAIADGYLNSADQGFVADARHGFRYQTGDLVRRIPTGAWLFLGRRDHRVQIHGHRVELGEIEAALCRLDGVRAARVDYRQSRLVAAIEVPDGPFPDDRDVRAFVAARLPAHMVPHEIQGTRQLERNSTGKVVRPRAIDGHPPPEPAPAAMPTPAGAPTPAPAATPAPTPAAKLESEMGRIWQRLLRLDRPPGGSDDFFLLGGDSLLAIEMVLEAEPLVGRRISPLVVHAHHRLSQLARALADASSAPASATPVAVAPDADLPLGPVQRGFWLASRAGGVQPIWTVRLPIRGPLVWEAFAAGVEWVQARHPILRARFGGEPHRPTQQFGAGPQILTQFDDLSALPGDVRDRALAQRHEEELAAEIPLRDEPLLRLRLSRVSADEHILFASGHHIVSDAHSAWILLAELFEHCRRIGRGEIVAPPVPEIRYADVLAAPAAGPDPFWREYLGTLGADQAAELPEPPGRGDGYARVVLDAETFARLRRAAALAGTSPFGLVFTAVAQGLHGLIGGDRFVLATATAGREADPEGWSDAIGPFAYGVPVIVNRGPDSAVIESLHQALAHAASVPATLPALLGAAGSARLGRYFVSWLETSATARLVPGDLAPCWDEIDLRFRTDATATAVSVAALAHDGLTIHVRGRADVGALARDIEHRLRQASQATSALIVYAPDGVPVPFAEPTLVETVRGGGGVTDIVLLPLQEGDLGDHTRLRALVRRAIDGTRASVVALAGMLPSLTGLAAERLSERDVILTTGHAVTVVAMLRTVERILGATGREWGEVRVGVVGFGAVGQAVLQLCVSRLGRPALVSIADPRFGTRVAALEHCNLILGAASAGRVLDVDSLAPGTLVVDDSFPRCFSDNQAWRRMEQARDVLLVGGGMMDVGALGRVSPFPQAEAVRAQFPSRWLPGCQAEALLLSLRPDLGPTVGPVDLGRALRILAAVDALGWRAAPLHLGPREIPADWPSTLRPA